MSTGFRHPGAGRIGLTHFDPLGLKRSRLICKPFILKYLHTVCTAAIVGGHLTGFTDLNGLRVRDVKDIKDGRNDPA
jgi:hypothetical protein